MGKLKINYNKAFTTKYSRDYYRGTSFHYCGKWDVGQHYTCDEFNVDFVVCNQALFVCTKSHVSSEKNKPDEKYIVRDEGGNIIGINSVYWDFVMSGLGAGIEIFEYLIRTGRILSRAQTEELIANVEFDVEHLGINFEQAIHNLDQDITDRYTSAINVTANEIRSEVAHDVDDLNGTISRNRSEMLQTAEAITNTVEAYKSELDGTISENYSVLDQKADSISATVAANKIDAEGKINTVQANLTLAADQISTRVSEVEDDVTTKYSEIIQTTDSITSTVAANKQETDEAIGNLDTELSSQIQQTAEAITAEVSARTTSEGQIISDYNTKITQTAAAITSEASARQAAIDGVQTDYNSKFEQTAQAITSEVTARQTAIDNVERDYNSKIEQTAQDISAEVSARETAIDGVQADYNAKIDINAQAITSEVSARQTADNEIQTDYNSKITQTAEAIESEVTARQSADNALSADYNSKITQTATQIRSEVNEHVETLEGEIDSTNSALTQTAGEIRAEVANTKTDLEGQISTAKAEIKVTTDAITNTVESYKEELDGTIENNYSVLEQRADSISSTVVANKEDADGKINTVQSNLTQTANDIRAQVTANKEEIAGAIADLSSSLTLTAEEIRGEVSQSITDTTTNITTAYNSAISQKANEITSSVKATTDALGDRLTTAETAITQNSDSISLTAERLNTTNTNLGNYISSNNTIIESLQSQIDGAIDTWFYEGAPTLSNAPASSWDTDDKKKVHIGDLYYDKSTGHAYRFEKDGSVYKWTLIQDSDIARALADAAEAKETADGKMSIFYTQPSTYRIGDMWIMEVAHEGDTNDKKDCIIKKSEANRDKNYVASDWVLVSDIANATKVKAAFNIMADMIDSQVAEYTSDNELIPGSLYSHILQSREQISLKIGTAKSEAISDATGKVNGVKQNLLDTGIDITNGLIVLTANNIKMQGNTGNPYLLCTEIDGKPVIKAENLQLSGVLSLSAWNAGKTALEQYAEGKANTAETNAKGYADTKKTEAIDAAKVYSDSPDYLDSIKGTITAGFATTESVNNAIAGLDYLKAALTEESTVIQGGLVLSSLIQLGSGAKTSSWQVWSGLNGQIASGHTVADTIAFWAGGDMTESGSRAAKAVIRMDGTGYLAGGNISWDTNGSAKFNGEVTASKFTIGTNASVSGLKASQVSGVATAEALATTNANVSSAQQKADNAYDLANGKANPSDITTAKTTLAKNLGYADYAAMEAAYTNGNTIVDGATIRTGLIDADALTVKSVLVNDAKGGSITVTNGSGETLFSATKNGVTVKGAITATSLTLQSGATIPSGNISGLGSLATQNSVSTSQVTGLGALATKDKVNASSDVTGLGTLATKSSISTSDVVGLGALATKNKVAAGTDITGLGALATQDSVAYNSLTGKPDLSIYLTSEAAASTYVKPSDLGDYVETNVGLGPDAQHINFIVDSDGLLQAKNAILYGSVYANAGAIGGILISDNAIASSNGNFSVNSSGDVYANSITLANGVIGGSTGNFNFGSTTSGNRSATTISWLKAGDITGFSDTTNSGIYIGTDGINIGGKFKVDDAGNITATGLRITSSQISDKNSMLSSYTKKSDISYLTSGWTQISGGMVLSSLIKLGYTSEYLMIYGREDDYYVATDRVVDYDVLSNFVYYECPECQGDPDRFIDEWDLTDIDNLEMFLYDNHFDYEYADSDFKCTGGINGRIDTSKYGKGIAGWFGGDMLDRYYTSASNAAKIVFRMDGSGYLASNHIYWDTNGNSTFDGRIIATSGKISCLDITPHYLIFSPDINEKSVGDGYGYIQMNEGFLISESRRKVEDGLYNLFARFCVGLANPEQYRTSKTISTANCYVSRALDQTSLEECTNIGLVSLAEGDNANNYAIDATSRYGELACGIKITADHAPTTYGMIINCSPEAFNYNTTDCYGIDVSCNDGYNRRGIKVSSGSLEETGGGYNYGIDISTLGRSKTNYAINAIASGNSSTNYGIKITTSGTSATNYGINVNTSGSSAINYGIKVSASGGTTNYAFYCPDGIFAGLRPKVRYITSSSSSSAKKLTEYDYTLIVDNTNEITVTLPSSPKDGQTYIIVHIRTPKLFISGNGNQIRANAGAGDAYKENTSSYSARGTMILVWSATYGYWVLDGLAVDTAQ